jgi:enterochelin esterase family protein
MARLLSALGLALLASTATAQEPLNTATLRKALAEHPTGDAAKTLAQQVRKWYGNGQVPKIEELDVTWVVASEIPFKDIKVVDEEGKFTLPLERIGETDVYVGSTTFPEGYAMAWHFETEGKPRPRPPAKKGGAQGPAQLEVYRTHPDNVRKDGVPHGKLTQMPAWKSKTFDGTTRDWWVYVPAQYTPEKPACVMVFQDGAGYRGFIPDVFDNLIAAGEMPVTVGVFIQPGSLANGRSNRSFEYDTLSDQYARFLLEEILPEVEKTTKLRHDPEARAVAGISSGGICAFTVAWERPGEFSKVLSWVGSFTNIASGKTTREGGHNYEALIRKTPKKPIRVFLQDGAHDLDNNNGNWPLANRQMAKSLAFSHYDYKFVFGEGFHSNKHGRAILADSLRWLWRDVK